MHTNFGLNFLKILIHTPFKDGCSCPINLVTRPGQQGLPRREMGIRWDFFVRRRYKMKLHRLKERRKFIFHFYLIILHNIFFPLLPVWRRKACVPCVWSTSTFRARILDQFGEFCVKSQNILKLIFFFGFVTTLFDIILISQGEITYRSL